MRTMGFIAGSTLIVLTGIQAAARQTPQPLPSPQTRAMAPETSNSTASSQLNCGAIRITGIVIDFRGAPVGNARLVLRNLVTGAVEKQGVSNAKGEYAFEAPQASTYVVEMVDPRDSVIALSNAGSVGRCETLPTVIRLPGIWDANRAQVVMAQQVIDYFGMSAETSLTAGTLRLAEQQRITPANAGEPISPNF